MLKKDYTKYSGSIKGKESANPSISNDNIQNAYGLEKDRQGVFMLDVRQKNGDRTALPYSYFTAFRFNKSGELVLEHTSYHVSISGRNLGELYGYLLNHRVIFVQEEDPKYDTTEESATFIEKIVVKEV
jgi:hypothetical protein